MNSASSKSTASQSVDSRKLHRTTAIDGHRRTLSPRYSAPRSWPRGTGERIGWILAVLVGMFLLMKLPLWLSLLAVFLALGLIAEPAIASTAFGSARFATTSDLEKNELLGDSGYVLGREITERAKLGPALHGLFLGPWSDSRATCRSFRAALLGRREPDAKWIRVPDEQHMHTLICAASGAGKSSGYVMTNLMLQRDNAVVCDLKGELYRKSAKIRSRCLNSRVIRLDPMEECGPGGDSINFLDGIDVNSSTVNEACQDLADALVVPQGSESDPHWNESAKIGISAAILYTATFAAPEDRHLNTVAELLTDPEAFRGMVALMCDYSCELFKSYGNTIAYPLLRRYGGMMAAWEDRELSSIRSTISRHLNWLNSPLVARHLSRSSFDIRDLYRGERLTVYMVIAPRHLVSLSRLLRLYITAFYRTMTEGGGQSNRRTHFLLDEVAQIGPLSSLYQALTLGRSYSVRVSLVVQSLGQLKVLFPREGERLAVESCIDHRLFFGIRDYETAESLSKYIGQTTITVTSQTQGRGTSQSGSLLGSLVGNERYGTSKNENESSTASLTGRRLLMPEELLQFSPDELLILTKGVPPIRARLARYFECPELAHLLPHVGSDHWGVGSRD